MEIVRRCAEFMNRRDLSQLVELVDPEIEVDLSRNIFNPDIYRGHAGLERWRSVIDDVSDDFRGVLEETIDAGMTKWWPRSPSMERGKGAALR